MGISVWPLPVVGGRRAVDEARPSGDPLPSPMAAYSGAVFQSLALFRFFSYALGVGLVLGLNTGDQPSQTLGVAVMIIGLYNTLRVAWRPNPSAYDGPAKWLVLASDVGLSVALVFVTGGLDSPFLIYSLAPILAASLLMHLRQAMAVALVSTLSISGAYVAGGLGLDAFPWVLDGNYLVLSVLYLAVCFLTAYLPFLANLNLQNRIHLESRDLERQRLRREVHDNVAQTLAFLSLKMQHAERRASSSNGALAIRDVAEVSKVVQRAYVAVRDYLDGASDSESDGPLGARLSRVCSQWSHDTGLPVDISIDGEQLEPSASAKVQLLQIAREALANIAKHANATRAWVRLCFASAELTLRVRDDGRGFPTLQSRGHGLDIMAERAAMVGASLSFNSVPGEGTEVIASYPFSGARGMGPHEQHPGASGR